MREKYEAMIISRFEPLISDACFLHQAEKEKITQEVKKEFGLYDLKARIAAADLQLRELNTLLLSRAGPYNGYVNSEVDKRLEKSDGVYSNLIAEKTKAVEAVRLAGAPDIVVKLLKEIERNLPSLQKQVTQAKKNKQIKQVKELKK